MIPIAKPLISDEEKEEVMKVLGTGILAQGPKVKEFERAFADYIGVKYGVATSSGTTALHIALLCLNVKQGDEVITTPLTFYSTASTILMCGAKPVFVDVQPDTYNIDPNEVKKAITEKTKVILPVHLYGQPCDMDELLEIADEHHIPIIEDACQAHGAEYGGRKVGSLGKISVFSFYPTKNMTTVEGGMITTNDEALAEKARLLRDHGAPERYRHIALGYNYRMSDVYAAIGLGQLKHLDEYNSIRIRNAGILTQTLQDEKWLVTPRVKEGRKHVFHLYVLLTSHANSLIHHLRKRGVGATASYPVPLYRQEVFRHYPFKAHECKNAENIAPQQVCLPVHPAVSAEDAEYIAGQVVSYWRKS